MNSSISVPSEEMADQAGHDDHHSGLDRESQNNGNASATTKALPPM